MHDELKWFQQQTLYKRLMRRLPMDLRVWLCGSGNGRQRSREREGLADNVHRSARISEELRAEFEDKEGQGETLRSAAEREKQKKEYDKKLKKVQKRLRERTTKKNFKRTSLVVPFDNDYESYLHAHTLNPQKEPGHFPGGKSSKSTKRIDKGENKEAQDRLMGREFDEELERELSLGNLNANDESHALDKELAQFAIDAIPSELDKWRRQDLSALLVPIDLVSDKHFRRYFAVWTVAAPVVVLICLLVFTPKYTLSQPLLLFNVSPSNLQMDSIFILFLSFYCDIKEVIHVVRHIVPCQDSFVPFVTADLSHEKKSLFVSHWELPLGNVRECVAYSKYYAWYLCVGLLLGVFPYALFMELLRNIALDYSAQRYVIPMFGTILVVRALLGPTFVLKAIHALKFVFSMSYLDREAIGSALKSESAREIALTAAISITVLGAFFAALIDPSVLQFVIIGGFFGGGLFGWLTGAAHDLPVKPWICKCMLAIFLCRLLQLVYSV
jgi:hypothetical protein